MKKLITLSFLGLAVVANAKDLKCTGDARYEVVVRGNKEALVYKEGAVAKFGSLGCTSFQGRLFCYSKNVADAGYGLEVGNGLYGLQARLGEVWIGGVRPLATLNCREE